MTSSSVLASLTQTFIVLLHSKRTWALVSSMVLLIAKEFWPDKADSIFALIAMLGAWMVGESVRPAGLPKPLYDRYYST